jgi:hypothetical protein
MKNDLRLAAVMVSFLVLSSAVYGQETCGEWRKMRTSDGITGYERKNPRSPINEVKAIGIVDSHVAVLEAVVRDIPAEEQWMFMCSKAYKIDPPNYPSSADSYYSFFRQGLPWPVSDRYAVVRHELTVDKTKGILTLEGKGVVIPAPAKESGGIRLPLIEVLCIMTPLPENKTEVTYQILADVGGSLPTPILQMLTKSLAVDTIKNVRKMVKKEPYRSARTIVTTTLRADARQ